MYFIITIIKVFKHSWWTLD